MLRRLLRNKKAQNTAEYAILIALVVAAIVAMQTYAQRALQGRIRDASQYLKDQTNELGNTLQYEPYYLTQTYNVARDDSESQFLTQNQTTQFVNSFETRLKGGSQTFQAEGVNGMLYNEM